MRLYDLKGQPRGLWGGWFDFATSKGGKTSTGDENSHHRRIRVRAAPSTPGVARRLSHVFDPVRNRSGQQLQQPSNGTTIPQRRFSIGQDRLLVAEHVLFQPNDRFAIMPIFIYQRTKDGNPQHGWNQWVSFGARPESSSPNLLAGVRSGIRSHALRTRLHGLVR